MRFEWDEAKNQTNRQKHGLDFADAAVVFAGATLTFEDHRHARSEPRYLTVGTLAGRMVIIRPHVPRRRNTDHLDEEGQCP